jgi:hypothetical protein
MYIPFKCIVECQCLGVGSQFVITDQGVNSPATAGARVHLLDRTVYNAYWCVTWERERGQRHGGLRACHPRARHIIAGYIKALRTSSALFVFTLPLFLQVHKKSMIAEDMVSCRCLKVLRCDAWGSGLSAYALKCTRTSTHEGTPGRSMQCHVFGTEFSSRVYHVPGSKI